VTWGGMFRKSRSAILIVAFFFFLTGTLTAYVRCLENVGSLSDRPEAGNAEDEKPYSDTASLHCPDDLKAYATGQLTRQNYKDETNYIAVSRSRPAEPPFISGISAGRSPSFFPYRLVPLYQCNVVYRI